MHGMTRQALRRLRPGVFRRGTLRSAQQLALGAGALLALALLLAPAGTTLAAAKARRFGIEAELLRYDEARDVVVVKVVKTKVSTGPGGNTVGGPAPSSVRRGQELELAVVPEGSVLRRTVVKDRAGTGLDNSGTRDGFRQALATIPSGRPVIFSFEKNEPGNVKNGQPEWLCRLVQIQMTEEEIQRHMDEISVEE